MSSIELPMKRKLSASEKTPITILQELCTQENELVTYENIPHATDPIMFSYLVSAFDTVARGSGRSKQEAKHEASANLIAQLMNMDRFKQILQKLPQTPRPIFDSDAVAVLLEFCVQRNFAIPTFDVKESSGESNAPVYTCVCKLSNITRSGTSTTKKGAKQIAARAMLDVIQNIVQNEEQKSIETIEADPPEKIFRAYRECKELPVKTKALRIRNRHSFFLQLPEVDRNEAKKILMDDSSIIYGTTKDRVDLACAALKLKYNIQDVQNHPLQFKTFMANLVGDHSCVIAAKEPDLYNHVISYFKTMLDLQ